MRFTIDFDPTSATVGVSPTVTRGQDPTERNTRAGLPESGLDAGAFSAILEGQTTTTEKAVQAITPESNLNAGACTFTQPLARSPGASRERNVVSIAEPPPPHADEFGLAPVPKKSQATSESGSSKM